MANSYLSDTGWFSQFRSKLRLYFPSVYFVLDETYNTVTGNSDTLLSIDLNSEDTPLAYALQQEQRQRTVLNSLTAAAIFLGAGAAAAFILLTPFGWGLAATILGTIVCVAIVPTVVRNLVKAIQALKNKVQTRINITYVSELTDKKAETLGKKIGLDPGNINILKSKFKDINNDPATNKGRLLTDAELADISTVIPFGQEKLKYLLGFTVEKIKKLKEVLGTSENISLFRLRWISGGTHPLDNQNISIHAKTGTKVTTAALIGAVFGGGFIAVSSFILSPLAALPLQIMASVIGVFLGARLGQEVGEGFVKNPAVNPVRTFDGLNKNNEDSKNHASRWWFKRLARHMVIAATLGVAAFAGLLVDAASVATTTLVAYSLAGTLSGLVMGLNRKSTKKTPAITAAASIPVTISSAPSVAPVPAPTPELLDSLTVKPLGVWQEDDIAAAKTFWLEYREKYIAKANISNMFAAIGHRVFFNIRFLWEKITNPIFSALPQNKAVRGIMHIPLVPVFAVSIVVGLVKSVFEGLFNLLTLRENSYTQLHAKHLIKKEAATAHLREIALYEYARAYGKDENDRGSSKERIQKTVQEYVDKKKSKTAPVPVAAADGSFLEGVKLYFTADTFAKQEKPASAPTPALRSMLNPPLLR